MNFQTTFSAKKEDGSAKSFNILQNERKIKQERRGKKNEKRSDSKKKKVGSRSVAFFPAFLPAKWISEARKVFIRQMCNKVKLFRELFFAEVQDRYSVSLNFR